MFDEPVNTPIVKISDEQITRSGVELFVKREDLTDPFISGNKYRKLKYNLLYARGQGYAKLLTFGGAYSNHIHALAYAGYKFGFETIGVIRGEERLPLNPTLREAATFGMKFYYISREAYHNKDQADFIENMHDMFGEFLMIPEGGSNVLAVKGCAEILSEHKTEFDQVCCPCGTGSTMAGLIAGSGGEANILGFPALKGGEFLKTDINNLLKAFGAPSYSNWKLVTDYHFGGYAKFRRELIEFINCFKIKHQIQLDPIYTGKMMYGVYDMVQKGAFQPGEKILTIHTGGLQGIKGFNDRFGSLLY